MDVNAALSFAERMELSGAVIITGLVVVFAALLLLIIAISVVGQFFKRRDSAKKDGGEKAKSAPVASAQANKPAAPSIKSASVEDGIDDEVVSVITAAIAAIMGNTSKPFAVKSIRRARDARPAWSMAGIIDNIRTF